MSKLAILGGTPILERHPEYMNWPRGDEATREALLRTLRSGVWGTLGKENERFANKYAAYCQTKHCLPVLNGTVSLELIFRALGIGWGDEVIVSPYTFSASVHSIVLAGAAPVFADTDPETFTLSPASVEERVTPRTRAILGVHLGGRPFDVDAISAIAEKHGLILIEDAAHAHGSEWRSHRCGSLGRAGSFSFQASKNLSCGEGGAITTNDTALYQRLWSMHHNGRDFEGQGYDHPLLGTDARLAEWQCAVLAAQMERLDGDIERRMRSAELLDRELAKLPFISVCRKDERITRNSLHLYPFRYHAERLGGLPREIFLKALNAEHVCRADSGYSEPIYRMKMLYTEDYSRMTGRTFADPAGDLPGNELLASSQGCWLQHTSLLGSDEDTLRVVEAFARVGEQAEELRRAFGQEG